MSIHNTYKGWRTSIIGVVFLAIGGAYLYFNQSPDSVISIFLFTMGGVGIIAPDKLLDKLLK